MQKYTSKNTSVNTSKLPAIYNKIDWDKIVKDWHNCEIHVWDMGCGRETSHVMKFLDQFGICYHGYDPNWKEGDSEESFDELFHHVWASDHFNIFICSNVLNVIYPWAEVLRFKRWFTYKADIYFISVYYNSSAKRGETKDDCWQWHKPLKEYLTNLETEMIKKDVLFPCVAKYYLK